MIATDIEDYKIIKKIASGAFGEIYLAIHIHTKVEFAIKIERKTQYKQLRYEHQIYKNLQKNSTNCICKIHAFGKLTFENEPTNAMVMDLLGHSLEDLFVMCDRKFSLKTVLMVGDLMLSRIEFLHYKHYVHRDNKPDNFAFGRKDNLKHNLYIIDFGLAKRFRNPVTYVHIPVKNDKPLVGTARYASVNTHLGVEQLRRDDLEALGHCPVYFLKRKLPWQSLPGKTKDEKYANIKKFKLNISVHELTEGCPTAILKFLMYVRHLDFDEMPNYCYLRGLLKDAMKENRIVYDYNFDWDKMKVKK